MSPSIDLTFITNDPGQSLLGRFKTLIKDAKSFDVLVAYFFISGFFKIYPLLKSAEKVRILVGINTDKTILKLSKQSDTSEPSLNQFSNAKSKQKIEESISKELENSNDAHDVSCQNPCDRVIK